MYKFLFLFFVMCNATFSSDLLRSFFPESFYLSVGKNIYYNYHSFKNGAELAVRKGEKTEILDLYPGIGSSSPREFLNLLGKVFFVARDEVLGFELWVIEESKEPKVVYDHFEGKVGSFPAYLTSCGGYLYYTAESKDKGREVVRLDPFSYERVVYDYSVGTSHSFPVKLFCVGDKLYFSIVHIVGHYGIYHINSSGKITQVYKTNKANSLKSLDRMGEALYFYGDSYLQRVPTEKKVEEKYRFEIDFQGIKVFLGSYLFIENGSVILAHLSEYDKLFSLRSVNLETKEVSRITNIDQVEISEIYSTVINNGHKFLVVREDSSKKLVELIFRGNRVEALDSKVRAKDLIFHMGKAYMREGILSEKLKIIDL